MAHIDNPQKMPGDASVKWYMRKSIRDAFSRSLVYLVLIGVGILVCLPFFWMISSSLKTEAEIFRFPPQWLPNKPMWGNYAEALSSFAFLRSFKNTAIITVSVILGRLISCSLAAFAFARMKFPGRNVLFFFVLSVMMVPSQVTMIPTFILFYQIGWVDTFLPLIVPAFLGAAPFHIFLLRQFFLSIPRELDEAAKIDGCSTFMIYTKIILPLAKPALATLVIFTFLEQWNDFMSPLIYLNSSTKHTLSIALNYFQNMGAYGPQVTWAHLMVVSLVIMFPCLLLFFFAQKHFIQGVVVSGVKG